MKHLSENFLNSALVEPLAEAISSAQTSLSQFALHEAFSAQIELAFGDKVDRKKLSKLREQWVQGNITELPMVEIRSAAEINEANGAFSFQTGKIYLAEEFLLANGSDTEAIAKVIIEEYGHYVDSQINSSDTPGDEGAIFAALVLGEDLSEDRLQELREEDDSAVVVIDGEEIAIEQALDFKTKKTTPFRSINGLLKKDGGRHLVAENLTSEGIPEFTYSFLNKKSAGFDNSAFKKLKDGFAQQSFNWSSEKDQVVYALELISNVANISFREIKEDDKDADFKFILTNAKYSGWDKDSKAGRAYPPGYLASGFVYFNKDNSDWKKGIKQGNRIFSTIFHEIMHGLGLEHPHDGVEYLGLEYTSKKDKVIDKKYSLGTNGLNSGLWTSMSYNRGGGGRGKTPGTPMGFDIAALQYLYGANKNYRINPKDPNDVYFLSKIDKQGFQTIWDTYGTDTISAAGQNKSAKIDLRNMPLAGGKYSGNLPVSHIGRFDNANSGFTIAPFPLDADNKEKVNYIIENATGSSAKDIITGNGGKNVLRGGGGNDTLYGLSGNDKISGGSGDDKIYGTLLSNVNEKDLLLGGAGKNTFFLGNNSQLYYNDGDTDSSGKKDYALILDYKEDEDVLKFGKKAIDDSNTDFKYTNATLKDGRKGKVIYYKKGQVVNEAIAFLVNSPPPSSTENSNPSITIQSNNSADSSNFNLLSPFVAFDEESSELTIDDLDIIEESEEFSITDLNVEFFDWDKNDINVIQAGLESLLEDVYDNAVGKLIGDEENKNIFLSSISQEIINIIKNGDRLSFFTDIGKFINNEAELNLPASFIPDDFVREVNKQLNNNGFDEVTISLVEDNGDEVIFGLDITNSFTDSIKLENLGFPDLDFSFDGNIDFDFEASAAINFGVNVDTNEFFVDTGLQREVDVNLNIQNSDTLAAALGEDFVEITASDRSVDDEEELFEENPGKAFQASLNFGLDLQDTSDNGDGRLTTDEIVDSSLEPSLIGELNINPLLEIDTGINGIPTLDTTLDYNAQYNFLTDKFVAPEEVVTPDNNIAPVLFLDGEEVNSDIAVKIVSNKVSNLIVDNLDLSEIVQEFDRFLAQIEDTLNSDIFELDIPFLGDALSRNLDATGFITDIRNSLSNGFQDFTSSGVEALVTKLNDLEYITAEDITEENGNKIVINIGLDSNDENSDEIKFETNLAPDLGVLDSLDLDISAKADIKLDFLAENALQVTINKDNGTIDFDLGGDSSNEPDLKIGLSLELDENDVFSGKLGFLDVNLKSIVGNNDFKFGVGLDLDTFDYEFDYSDLSVIDLYKLEVAAPNLGDIGGLPTVTLPKFSTILSFDFNQLTNSEEEFELPFAFTDVKIDATSLYEQFLGSFVKALDPIIKPVTKFTDALESDIKPLTKVDAIRDFFDDPQLSLGSGDGDGKVTLIEVATNPFISGQSLGGNAETGNPIEEYEEYQVFIKSIKDIAGFATKINELANSGGEINLGSISNLTSENLTDERDLPVSSESEAVVGQLDDVLPEGLVIPLFNDPLGTAFNILTGANNVSLIEYTIPELSFNTQLSKFFPVVGPLGVRLGGSLSANANLGFGFDTYGLQTGNQIQGFYILDEFDGVDIPEFNLNARVTAEGGAELGVGRGFVGGNLTGDVNFDLADPDDDGRIRPNEISGDLTELFGVSAELTAGLQAWFEVGYGRLSVREDFDFGSITLLETELNEPPFNPALGYVVDGNLILNQGSDRAVAQTETNEQFQIAQTADGAVQIVAFNNTQSFSGVNLISGNGRDGNDTLEAFPEVTVAAEFDGGSGEDNLIGGSGEDTLLGGSDNDRLEGKAGNDSLEGESGDDRLFGGTGDDELKGDRGNDNLVGEAGDDILEGDRGRDTLAGGAGDDNLSGGSDRDTLYGGVGDDILDGGSDGDYLEGEEGNDSLKGEFGEDSLYGGKGNDTLAGGDSDDYLDGGENDDTLLGDSGEDTLYGRSGNDSLDGGFGTDVLYGEAGDDTLYGNLGEDTLYGAAGADSLIGGVDNDLLEGDIGNDTLEGSDGEDTLLGDEGNDSLLGGQGDDSLVGFVGDDELAGEGGNDELYGDSGRDNLLGGSEDDKLYGGIDDDNLSGGSENDELYGGEGNDELSGDAGEDTLEGESGDDTLRGGSDTDVLIGGGGEDLLDGEAGTDSLFGGFGEDVLQGGAQDDVLYGEGGKDTLDGGADNDSLFGGLEDDTLEGGSGNDTLFGEEGFDILDGQAGDDSLEGGLAADTLNGGDGSDIVKGGEGNDLIQGDDENSFVESSEEFNDTLEGEAGDDELFGASGNDVLIGGDGDDTLAGGFGNDTLIGDDPEKSDPEGDSTEENDTNTDNKSKGKNVFVLAPNQGTDIIKHFTLLPENFDPEAQEEEIEDADIILLSDGLSFNFIEIVEGKVVDSEGKTIEGAAIIDKDTNETLAILEGIEPERLSRAYFDEENVAPDRLEFESKKPVYAQDETVTLVNTLVRDANGIQDVELIDFWLQGYEGENVWTDLNNFLTGLNGNIGFSDLNNLNSQTPIGEQITINNAHWLDYDGDSDLDVFTVRQGYQQLNSFQSIYQNQGEDEFNQTNILPGYSVTGNAWADYDDDGDLDLVGESFAGEIQKTGIWQNNDNNFTFVELEATASIKNGTAAWGDYDNDDDDDLDLIVTGVDAEDESQVRTQLFNNNDGELTEVDTNLPGNVGTVDWGDADKDGDLDLVISGAADPRTDSFITTVYLNNDGTFDGVFTVEDVKQGTVKWGDFNGDNNLDFAVVGAVETEIIVEEDGEEQIAVVDRGFARIYQGDGAGGFGLLQELEGVQDSSVDWGDYDSDGDLDLLITGLSNQFRLTENGEFVRIPATYIYRYERETNSFSQIIPNLPEVGGGNSSWGDYDNDDDLDILVSGFDFFNNPITKVYRNDGYGTYGNEWQQSDFGNHIFFGAEVRRDVFVIDTESEIETIYNFKPGQDLLYLSNDLTFDDLELQNLESGDTAIVLKSDNRTLAILQNVTAAKISESDSAITLTKDSRDVVLDNFDPESDLIYLTGGLNSDIIKLVTAENNTQIILSGTNEVIATVNNASSEDIKTAIEISESDLVISLNKDSRNINIDNFDGDRSLIYLKEGLNNDIIELVTAEDNTQVILSGTSEVIANINNVAPEDIESNLIAERINFIDPVFTAFNKDSRLASFDYELNGLAPGEYTLRGTAYDHETANEIISQGVTLVPPSAAALDSDTGLVELKGNQVIDWIYQVGSVENDSSSGIAVDSSGRIHFVGRTGGELPNQTPPEFEQQRDNTDFWYGSITSQGTSAETTQILTTSGRTLLEGGELFEAGGNVTKVAGVVAYDNSLYTIRNFTDNTPDGNVYFTRIEQIDPVSREIIESIDSDIQDSNRQDFDLAVDSLGNLYSVGFTNASGTKNALLSKYDRETLFNSTSISIGADAITEGTAIAIDSDDNIYITGQTTGTLVADIDREDSDQFDIWVAKYQNNEESGLEKVWIQQFSLGEVEFATDVAVDSNNNVYVIGEILGIEGGDIVGKDRIWFTKFQANGDRLWTEILDFDSSLADLPKGITIDDSDNIYITGESRTGEPLNGQTDVFLAKYNVDGNLLWTQDFGTSANDRVEDLTVDSNGNLYLTGSTTSELNGQNQGDGNAWVAKFNDLENSDRIEKERFILGDSTGNFYGSGKVARITGFDAAIGDTIQLHGSSEDYVLDTYTVQRLVNGILRVVETGVNIAYKPNDDAFPEEIARIVDGNISTSDRQLGLRKTTEFQAGNVDFVSAREDNVESTDFTINNNGTSNDDELIGTADASDVLTGGDGDDKLVGNLGGDYLDGGTGNDILYSGTESEPSEEVIQNPEESKTYSFLYGWEGNDELYGSGFSDELYGGTGNDVIAGGAGNDTLDGGQGDDVLDGGAGTDVISYRDELASVVINLETGTVRDSQNGTDSFSNIEGAIASEYADTIIGDANNNILTGLAGDDIINAGAGNDRIEAGQGSDLVDAGAGNDTLINTDGNDTLLGGRGNDTYDLRGQEELTVEAAFTALGGGHRQQGYIYNADNFPISFDTFRRFVFDLLTPKLDEFGLEIVTVTEEDSDEPLPVLGDNGFPLLRQKDYPLQILDAGGIDNLTLEEEDIQPVDLEENEYPSTRGDRIGVAQRGSSLVIDYNKNVYPSLQNDIVINNFFDFENPGEADTGFIETLDGIDSNEILALAQPFTPIDFEVPEVETGFWTNSGSWGDYDNDGDLDFAIASGDDAGNGFTRIYRNDEGEFVFAASLEGYSEVTSLDWGDYDGDGDLDVLIAGKDGQPTQNDDGTFDPNSGYKAAVFRNEGGDRFSNAESINIESETNSEPIFANWGNYITKLSTESDPSDNALDILLRGSSIPQSESDNFAPVWGYQAVVATTENGFGEVKPWQFGELQADGQYAIGNSNNATNAWGDYNNDGNLDVLVVESSRIVLYTNEDGDFKFNENNENSFILNNLAENSDDEPTPLKSSASFGDYNNDGFLDILTTRYSTDGYAQVTVFAGNDTQEFTEIPTLIPNTYNGEASWGDYDNDGDLDILLIGTAGEDNEEGLPFAQIYRNNIATPNTAPQTPTNLRISAEGGVNGFSGETIRFQWDSAIDADIETEDVSLTYNLRIGTTPGGSEILAAESISDDGNLLSPEIGNLGTNLEYVIDNTSGFKRGVTYYWSVQAVDGGYLGSEFATESSFTYLPFDETPTEIDPVNGNSAWGDYDNDGDLDVVKGTNLFNNNLGESESIAFSADTTSNPSDEITDDRIDNAWGDYDGDGNLDLVVTGNDTAIYRNNADSTNTWIEQLGMNGEDSALFIATDPSGNVYVVGETTGDLVEEEETTGNEDIWLAKYNSSGDRLWTSQFGSTGFEFARGISVDNSGNVYLTGYTDGNLGNGEGNIWITKYNTNGSRDAGFGNTENGFIQYGSDSAFSESQDIAVDNSGNLYVTGYTNSSDVWIQKYDADGTFIKDLPIISTDESEFVSAIAIDDEDNVYITGTTKGQLGENSFGSSDVWLAKYTADGELDTNFGAEGIIQYGTENRDSSYDVTTDKEGNVYLAGGTGNLAWIIKYNSQGEQQWQQETTTEVRVDIYSTPAIVTDSEGNVYLSGATNNSSESRDGFVVKYDKDGDLVAKEDTVFTQYDAISDIAIDGSDNVYVAGRTEDESNEDNSSNFDAWISKISLNISLPQVNNGAVTWGDYDNDGALDLFLIGNNDENGLIARIYRNQGELGFTLDENQNALTALTDGDAAWADYDNDGDLDLAVIGKNNENIAIAGIYQNNLGILNNFITLNPEGSNYISEVNPNSIAWGDYNNDGYLDLLVTASTDTDSYHQIYQNNQDDSFSDIQAEELGETSPNGKSTWADFNNDGRLDVILSGEQHATFENQDGQFQRTYFRDVNDLDLDNALAAADYDRDGDLDFLANPTGNNNRLGTIDESSAPAIYENLLQDRANNLPVAPTELTAATDKNSVSLEWNLGLDEETPVEGLTYNLRVGTTPGGNDIVASMSNSEGLRSLPTLGNVNNNTQWQLSNLPNGTYYWSVQTIDSTLAGSSFSDEGEFTISNPEIEIENVEIVEGDSGEVEAEFTVTLNVETISEPITVDYQTLDATATAGEDYEAASGTLTFNPATEDNPAELTKTIKVKVFGDREEEKNETFSLQLSNVSDNAEILTSKATATITEEPTDGKPLFPDYSFTELKVNGAETNISLERGSMVNIEGAIANLTEFEPENPPSYRFYISEDENIDPVLEVKENDSLVVDEKTGLITDIPTGVELSEDIVLVTQDTNAEFINGQYVFNETNILIPATLSDGEFFLIAEANPGEIQEETQLDNNVLKIPVTFVTTTNEADIIEEQKEISERNRNEIATDNPSLLEDLLVDLSVSGINVSQQAQNSESFDVSFTVSNEENSALVKSETWTTQIYLSNDNLPDASDLLLKETIRSEVLSANSSQIIIDTVGISNSVSGENYLFVVASPIEQLDLQTNNNIGVVPLDII